MWYHEWHDTAQGEWPLAPVHELRTEDACYYYNKQELFRGGYLNDSTAEIDVNDLKLDGIIRSGLMMIIVMVWRVKSTA